jgi:hypothetical protein
MWSREVFIARAIYGIECKSRSLVLQLQSAEVSRKVTSSFVWSWTISVNVNEGIQDPENWTQYVHLYQHYSLFMSNKLQYTWLGDYCECVRPAQLPILTEIRAPSLLEQYPRYVPHRDRAGYNNDLSVQKFCHIKLNKTCARSGKTTGRS